MPENTAVALLIVLSLFAANVPFLLERPLLVLPWARQGSCARSWWVRWTMAVLLLAALMGVGWFAQRWIGQAVVGGGVQALLLLLRVLAVIAAVMALLIVPGWYLGQTHPVKPLVHRLLELLVLYVLVGMLGVALEASLGSVFVQRWEFYAVSASLFLTMAYPGFVARYLLKRKTSTRSTVVAAKTTHGKDR